MAYWHIQMNLPQGRGGTVINSRLMLEENPPIIGTGEWDDTQCYQFKNKVHSGLKNGDIILVREGINVLALCKVTGDAFQDATLAQKYLNENFRHVEILDWYTGNKPFPQPQGTLQRLINNGTDSWKFVNSWYRNISLNKIMESKIKILQQKNQMILQGPPGTGKTFTAKDIAEKLIFDTVSSDKKEQKRKLEESNQFKLIQFHPAYSYEDFVRGITIENNGTQIEYQTKNKVLAEFALDASKNWDANQGSQEELSLESWVEGVLNDFKEDLLQKLEDENRIMITPKAYIRRVTENSIRYISDAWDGEGGVPISDIRKMYLANVKNRKEVIELGTLTKTAKSLPTYWLKVLEQFQKYITDNDLKPNTNLSRPSIKNYVLIIDEINRANLPAVLGELIYALEYRGESVDTMYEFEGDSKITLPENLYIIGTMNTADRSVGHIDYAIRRRFAFENVLPNRNVVNRISQDLFKKVSELFIKDYDNLDWNNLQPQKSEYVAADFNPEDVWMGHSYFISKYQDDEKAKKELQLKLEHEIKPLLKEYVKDGILKETIAPDGGNNMLKYIHELAL